MRLRVQIEPFLSTTYILSDIEPVDSAMFGPCLRARFRIEGREPRPFDVGLFRIDRMVLIEPVDEQLEIEAA